MTEPQEQALRAEERLQLGEDDIPQVVADALKSLDDGGTPCWPFLGERYISGYLELHLHFRRWAGGVKGVARDYCAIFKRAESHIVPGSEAKSAVRVLADRKRGIREHGASGQRMSMLVYVLQAVQHQERVRFRAIPTVVRLQLLDGFLDLGRCLPHARHGRLVEARRGRVDGELDPPLIGGNGGVGRDELPREVVERDTQVMDVVPDDENPVAGLSTIYSDAHEFLLRHSIVLMHNAVRFLAPERSDGRLESFQVGVRPVEGGPMLHDDPEPVVDLIE